MGLCNFPSSSEGVLPVLVLNTVLSVALLKNMVRSLLQAFTTSNLDMDDTRNARDVRRVSITRFKSLCHGHRHYSSAAAAAADNDGGGCCVCLCGFEADQEQIETKVLELKEKKQRLKIL
ncbi:hypothetical protein GQ457_03G008440 [Hibiscus cannabinus]